MADKLFSELQRGTWSADALYTIGDFVEFNGSCYVAIQDNQNKTPPNPGYWNLLASKGLPGDDGREVEIRTSESYIQWRYTGETTWTNLVKLTTLKGDQGEPGIQWKGTWNASTNYILRDVISSGGNSYICISSNTDKQPPNSTYWELMASKGLDGTGVGDVVGPANSTNNQVAVFDGTTGKLIKDGGETIEQIKWGVIKPVTTYNPTESGTTTLDLSLGNIFTVTMPADTQTLAISNKTIGQCFMVEIINTTSQGALTWFNTINWVGGIAPSLTGIGGKKDSFGFRVTGLGTYDGYIVGQNI